MQRRVRVVVRGGGFTCTLSWRPRDAESKHSVEMSPQRPTRQLLKPTERSSREAQLGFEPPQGRQAKRLLLLLEARLRGTSAIAAALPAWARGLHWCRCSEGRGEGKPPWEARPQSGWVGPPLGQGPA
ncbi:PR domain zinc finger protein 12 [Platysternon megacephalum]|uniref:PR domain zinc finger protein 12 n=1 Tax=Platysternon megacephalum TaxID=55544 RepID=A0A4D9EAU0_9SAUR|nr:PR domain zinc finger protein 12 [Platysternon megacephalum]